MKIMQMQASCSEMSYDRSIMEEVFSEQAHQSVGVRCFPYACDTSFRPVLEYWQSRLDDPDAGVAAMAKMASDALQATPTLLDPKTAIDAAQEHSDVVAIAMAGVFPTARRERILGKVSPPYSMQTLYATEAMRGLMESPGMQFKLPINVPEMTVSFLLDAFCLILNRHYGQSVSISDSMAFTIHNDDHTFQQHLKSLPHPEFLTVEPVGPLKPLSQSEIDALLADTMNLKAWLKALPPGSFRFEGLFVVGFEDLTEEESLSQITRRLLRRDAVMTPESIEELQLSVRHFLGAQDIRLGISALDYPLERSVAHRYRIRFGLLSRDYESLLGPETQGSIYEEACQSGDMVIAECLSNRSKMTPLENTLLEQGIHSLIVVPLTDSERSIIGLLEIGASRRFALNAFVAHRVNQLIPLFRTALERSRDEVDSAIDVLIRQKYTAVHPTVEWAFVQAGYALLEAKEEGRQSVPTPAITFEQVVPIYGQADIVGSSQKRNDSIQGDLIDNLRLAQATLEKIDSFPLADFQRQRIDDELKQLKGNIAATDEARVMELLHSNVHPLFRHLKQRDKRLVSHIDDYFEALDPELEVIYYRRKAYDASVAKINAALSSFLDREESETQTLFPHYFEKYLTDGIEYTIYAGASLLRNHAYDTSFLSNLRLWQLGSMIGVTRIIHDLQGELEMPLTTAQLILIHSNPLNIRFRLDEKQFDADGTYNIAYAILKKRIDKALILGTQQRLTQAGKVAIIYAMDKEREEYLGYIEHFIRKGQLETEVEELQLEPMPGAHGLKAIRVSPTLL